MLIPKVFLSLFLMPLLYLYGMKMQVNSFRLSSRSFFRYFFLLLLLPIIYVSASEPLKPLRKIETKQKGAHFSVLAVDVKTGEQLMSYRPQELMVAASTAKIVTTATALRLLGDGYRYATIVGYQGRIDNGRLEGDLIVQGSLDPSTASHYSPQDSARFLNELVGMLRAAGINQIRGEIIVDGALSSAEGVNPNWLREDFGNYYAAPSFGFNWNDNRIDLELTSRGVGGKVEMMEGRLPHPEVRWNNQMRVKKGRNTTRSYGLPRNMERTLTGSIPPHKSNISLKTDMPDPVGYAAHVIRCRLEKEGVAVDGTSRGLYYGEKTPSFSALLGVYHSLPLLELIKEINYRSINPWAESVLLTLDSQTPTSRKGGIRQMAAYWQAKGVDLNAFQMDDGSGLSVYTRLTAEALIQVLVEMAPRDAPLEEDAFYMSLPVAGKEGTVRSLKMSPDFTARLKSGAMRGVCNYAGYLTHDDRVVAVVIFANGLTNSTEARKAIVECLNELGEGL